MVTAAPDPAADAPPSPRPPRLTVAQMYERMLASDATCNGRFFTGVLTTGIYCLPACRARKPKLQNVKFFPTCEAARASGLRACRKCHPDDFARGADPVLVTIETLVGELRAAPGRFPDARAVVRRSGFGATRVGELFRQHYHATPAEVLLRARLEFARRALRESERPLADVAAEAGFESLSTFHENFRQHQGTTPAAYRRLPRGNSCEILLPPGYPVAYLRRALTRDTHSLNERLEGNRYTAAVATAGGPDLLRVELRATTLGASLTRGHGGEAHRLVTRLLGLDQDAAALARLAGKLGLGRLVAGREGLRLGQTPSVFDGLVWSILGQQINLAFASTLRARLTRLAGVPVAEGLIAPPTAAAVAALAPEQLLALQFSRTKAQYLIDAARQVVAGRLDLATLPTLSATRAERLLLAVPGLGPWSVNYIMMRSLGFPDCVPLGDTGVASGLQALLQLATRPDVPATRRLMSVFSPYRSLATAHLWQLPLPPPS